MRRRTSSRHGWHIFLAQWNWLPHVSVCGELTTCLQSHQCIQRCPGKNKFLDDIETASAFPNGQSALVMRVDTNGPDKVIYRYIICTHPPVAKLGLCDAIGWPTFVSWVVVVPQNLPGLCLTTSSRLPSLAIVCLNKNGYYLPVNPSRCRAICISVSRLRIRYLAENCSEWTLEHRASNITGANPISTCVREGFPAGVLQPAGRTQLGSVEHELSWVVACMMKVWYERWYVDIYMLEAALDCAAVNILFETRI
jgi:hypothetical protein